MSLAEHLLQDMTLVPTIKFMRSLSRHPNDSGRWNPVHLSFYIFNTWDFDLLIGQSVR